MTITDDDAADCNQDTREWSPPRGHEAQGCGGQIKVLPVPRRKGQLHRKDCGDGVLGRAAVGEGLDGEHAHGAVDVLAGWDTVRLLVQLGMRRG